MASHVGSSSSAGSLTHGGVKRDADVAGFEYDEVSSAIHGSYVRQVIHKYMYMYLFILYPDTEDKELAMTSGPSWGSTFFGLSIAWLQVASAGLAKGFPWPTALMSWLRIIGGFFSGSEWYFGIGSIEYKDYEICNIECGRLDIDECYSVSHIIMATLSFIFASWLLASVLVSGMTVYPSDKYGGESLARVHSYCDTANHIFITFLIIIWVAIDEESFPWALNIYLLVGSSFLLYLNVKFLPYLNLAANKFRSSMCALWFWLSVCLFITNLENDDDLISGGLVFYLASPFLVLVTVQAIRIRKKGIERTPLHKLSAAYQIELKLRFSTLTERYEAAVGMKGATEKVTERASDEYAQMTKKELYIEMENFFTEACKNMTTSPFLYLVWAKFYLSSYKRNTHKALRHLSSAVQHSPSLEQRFTIFKEQEVIRLRSIKSRSHRDVIRFLDFEKLSRKAQYNEIIIKKCHLEFWSEITKSNLDYRRMERIIGVLRESMDNATLFYRQALALKPNSEILLANYHNYLEKVLCDYNAAKKMKTKLYQLKIQQESALNKLLAEKEEGLTPQSTLNKSLFDEENVVLALSSADEHLGEILDCNSTCCEVFGYGRQELIGKNVSTLMPYPFNILHDSFLRQYLETGASKILESRRSVLALDKYGFLIPVELQIEELISKQMLPYFVGAIKLQDSEPAEYVMISNSGMVTDISRGIAELFTLPNDSIVLAHPFPVTDWFPLWDEQQDELKAGKLIEDFPSQSWGIINIKVWVMKVKIRDHVLSVLKAQVQKDKNGDSLTLKTLSISQAEQMVRKEGEDLFVLETTEPSGTQTSISKAKNVQFLHSSLEELTVGISDEKKVDVPEKEENENAQLMHSTMKLRETIFAEGTNTSKSLRRFKIVLAITCLLMIIFVVVSTLVLIKDLKNLDSEIEKESKVGYVKIFTASIIYTTEFLRIIDLGINSLPSYIGTRSSLATDLSWAADRLEYYAASLRDNGEIVGVDSPSPLGLVENVRIDRIYGSFETKNLDDAIMLMVANARMIANNNEDVNINTNPQAFYVLHNGPNYILSAIDIADSLEQQVAKNNYDDLKLESLIFLLVSVGLIFTVLVFMIIPTIVKAQNNKNRVFYMYQIVPRKTKAALFLRSENEYRFITGDEAVFQEEDVDFFAQGEELSKDIAELSNPDNRIGDGDKALVKQMNVKLDDKIKRRKGEGFNFGLIAKISILFLLVVAFFTYSYVSVFVLDEDLKKSSSPVISAAMDRRVQFRRSVYYLNQYASKAIDKTDNITITYQTLQKLQQELMFGNTTLGITGSLGIDSEQQNLLFDNGCPDSSAILAGTTLPLPKNTFAKSDCEAYNGKIFLSGLHVAINQAYVDLQSLESSVTSTRAANPSFSAVDLYNNLLQQSIFTAFLQGENIFFQQSLSVSDALYYNKVSDSIETDQGLIFILMICFIVATIIVYLFIYLPLVKQVSFATSRTQQMVFMLPPSVIHELHKNTEFNQLFKSVFKEYMSK
eukprot:Nk52_evm12s2241 gene=Nk52_evmTU12s2241